MALNRSALDMRAGCLPRCAAPHAPAGRPALRSAFLGQQCRRSDGHACSGPSCACQSRRAGSRRVTAMAAKVTGYIKLALDAGKANPAPPVGPALGSKGVNIMAFCKEYNAATQDKIGQVIPVEITVYEDRSFTFVLKTPPASFLIKKAAKVAKGAGEPQLQNGGKITVAQLQEIAEQKMPDLNCTKVEAAMNIIRGTAKNMGITVEG